MRSKIVSKVYSSALELIFKYGFHGTSMKMIVDHAGVSNGGVFHHFKTKDELIVSLKNHVKTEYYQELMKDFNLNVDTLSFIHKLWHKKLIWNIEHPTERYFLSLFSISSYESTNEDKLEEQLKELIDKLKLEKKLGIIDIPDIKYFIMEMDSSVNTLTRYLSSETLDYRTTDTENFFYRYWRSIIKLN